MQRDGLYLQMHALEIQSFQKLEGLSFFFFFYKAALTEMLAGQYRFTSWRATGKHDAHSCAYSGPRQVSPITPTPSSV
jgi:hypothetical protein